MSGSVQGVNWANVFWVNLAGGITATQAGFDAYVSSFGELYYNTWSDELPQGLQISSASGVLFQSLTTVLHSVHTMTHTGLVSAPFVADNAACWVISWTSNAYWRGGKPRTYIPGVQQSYLQSSRSLSTASVGNLRTKANNFHAAINALSATGITNTQHGFVKFFTGGTLLTPGVFYPISAALVHPRIGTQRRRLGAWFA